MTQSSQRGFTFIELIIVIGIIGILTAIGIPSYAQMKRNVVFNNSVDEVVNALRVAQVRAMTSQDGSAWGVHFEADDYTVYHGAWPATDGITSTLDGGVTISSAAATPDVIFNRLSGTTAAADVVVSIGSSQKTISIQPTGAISRL